LEGISRCVEYEQKKCGTLKGPLGLLIKNEREIWLQLVFIELFIDVDIDY